MKKLMFLTAASFAAACAFAQESEKKAETNAAPAAAEAELEEKDDAPIIWGFGNYGLYSGYQLYGSLVNSEPTLQGYAEANFNIPGEVKYFGNLGYLGAGVWSNTDLTDKRRNSLGKAFNEWDFNVHYGKTFWFDDDEKWGLAYRTSVVWYYYPHRRHDHMWGSTATTVDWNHYFELTNPYVTPYLNVVHEYHESDGNLLQFGLKKTVSATDALSLTPYLEFVWRNTNYGWCFPHYGKDANWEKINSCLATMRVGVDATYQITKYMGLFAKVAYCSVIDDDLRDAADACTGADYGKYKDYVWGGAGITFNF